MESPDHLKDWVQRNRPAFDNLEPRADLWAALERELGPTDETPTSPGPILTASRGGQSRAWWQMAAAAAVVFALGYSLRMQTEPGRGGGIVALSEAPLAASAAGPAADGMEPASFTDSAYPSGEELEPAMQGAMLTSNDLRAENASSVAEGRRQEVALAERLSRLEARYETLLSYHKKRPERSRFSSGRPLADEWDREMAVLDSSYDVLRHELPRAANPDEVVEAMTRNLHLRGSLLNKQIRALDAMQQARHRTGRPVPRRPPSVNPDATPALDDSPPGWYTPPVGPSPAPALDAPPRPAPGHGASAIVNLRRTLV